MNDQELKKSLDMAKFASEFKLMPLRFNRTKNRYEMYSSIGNQWEYHNNETGSWEKSDDSPSDIYVYAD